jgi:hypothetical protein
MRMETVEDSEDEVVCFCFEDGDEADDVHKRALLVPSFVISVHKFF